jgi:hypothetical protein
MLLGDSYFQENHTKKQVGITVASAVRSAVGRVNVDAKVGETAIPG